MGKVRAPRLFLHGDRIGCDHCSRAARHGRRRGHDTRGQPSRRSRRHCRPTYAPPSTPLEMRLTMALRNRAELTRLLADQQDPASPDYHRWLTPDEFTARFGPTDADLARVARWLKKKGFTVKSADASTREITFTGIGRAGADRFRREDCRDPRRPQLREYHRPGCARGPGAADRVDRTASTTCCTARLLFRNRASSASSPELRQWPG